MCVENQFVVYTRNRLLRARLSHSCGSSGGKLSGGRDNPALPHRGRDHQRRRIAVAINLLWRDHHVHRAANANQGDVNLLGQPAAVIVTWLDGQKVEVALGPQLSSRGGPEEDDSL